MFRYVCIQHASSDLLIMRLTAYAQEGSRWISLLISKTARLCTAHDLFIGRVVIARVVDTNESTFHLCTWLEMSFHKMIISSPKTEADSS